MCNELSSSTTASVRHYIYRQVVRREGGFKKVATDVKRRIRQSGRGLPHSKTLRDQRRPLEVCASFWTAPVLWRFAMFRLLTLAATASFPTRPQKILLTTLTSVLLC